MNDEVRNRLKKKNKLLAKKRELETTLREFSTERCIVEGLYKAAQIKGVDFLEKKYSEFLDIIEQTILNCTAQKVQIEYQLNNS